MNAFADALFSFLLGWIKGIVHWFSNIVSGKSADGFFIWLGDHWLTAAVILCLIGVLIDFIVWFFRWRPDLVWRTKWRHFSDRLHGRQMPRYEENSFYRGYDDSISGMTEENFAPSDPFIEQNSAPVFPENEESEPPVWEEFAEDPVQTEQEVIPVVRNRRSSRHRRNKKKHVLPHLRVHLLSDSDQDDSMLDGLPPIIDKKEAFHAPVYPQREKDHR